MSVASLMGVLFLVVVDGSLDGIFGQHGAVNLYRRQRQLFRDLRILDAHRFIQRLAFDPLRYQRAGGDGRATAVGLETRILDDAVIADLDLQLHDIAARWRAHHAGTDRLASFLSSLPTLRGFS
jgi:hypothetical protein